MFLRHDVQSGKINRHQIVTWDVLTCAQTSCAGMLRACQTFLLYLSLVIQIDAKAERSVDQPEEPPGSGPSGRSDMFATRGWGLRAGSRPGSAEEGSLGRRDESAG